MIRRFGCFLLLLLSLSLSGCTSGFYLEDVNRNLQEIRASVEHLYGIRSASANGRVLITGPMLKDPNDTTPRDKLTERIYARIVIVRDQRPYRVHVQVYEEEKIDGEWIELDIDERLSQEVAREINLNLIESREKRNVIDDFRAF